ncbi:lectin-like isoform X2 [Acipenser ruthenus]|uniref:lectin-like isoform X2 n=1 Tax=Acipenser ruthenus TaxID=7906 RepID=UPI002741A391|nr:lectin-like isoform X2 [Acipenser ruthenus]
MKITVLLMLAVAGFTATPVLAQIQMEKDAGLDVSALDTALGDLEDSDSTNIAETDTEDQDGIELDITEDAVDEDRSNMAKDSIKYSFFSMKKTFRDAELYCMNRFNRGHLAAVTSASINSQLAALVCRPNGQCPRTFVGGVRVKGTHFKWMDGSVWKYTNWKPMEPNNMFLNENCIEIFRNGDSRWSDVFCYVKRSFICSYRA